MLKVKVSAREKCLLPFLIIFFFVSWRAFVFAEEIPVNIKADQLKVIEESGVIRAVGSVEVRFKEVTIQSDSLYLDPKTNIATAEGRVKIFTKNYHSDSNYIIYDIDGGATTFSDFKTRISPGKVKGYLYLSARDLQEAGGEMIGEQGGITTCGDETPHYFMTATRVEYYPEDKVVGYNVIIHVGELPAFWLPLMYYDLSQKQKRNWVFGHNEVEGDYLKSAWGYPYGVLYLDLMEKKGFGHGTQVGYNLLGLGLGTLYLYHLEEEDSGITDWVSRINHTKQIDPWTTLQLDHDYTAIYLIPAGRKDQTSLGLQLKHQHEANWNINFRNYDDRISQLQKYSLGLDQSYEQVSTSYSLNYDFAKNDPKWIRSSQSLQHRRPLWSDNVSFSGRVNYHNNVAAAGEPGDERLEPEIEISGKEKGYSWRLSENWYIDYDQETFQGDEGYQYFEKQPELELYPDPVVYYDFSLKSTIGYGRYREVRYVAELGGNRDFATERYRASLNINRNIPLGLDSVAVLNLGIDQYFYTPGDQLYAYWESLNINTGLFGFVRNDITYRKELTDGNTPFLFDRLGRRAHHIREQLTFYYLDKFKWLIDGGHNWQTDKWFDVNSNLTLKPDERLYWNIRTGWDIENIKYKDMINSLNLLPYDFLRLEFAAVSDLNVGELRSGSVLYDLYLLKDEPNQLHLKISQIYEPATDEFKVRDIMIVKDLHCWELRYTYSDLRKEFSITFSLKALPDEPVGMSTGRGFYMESFEKEFNEFKQDGAVRRY